MDGEIVYPRFTYNQIQAEADRFLSTYHPTGEMPVPIEEIIEFQLKLDIVPEPELQRNFDVEGFLSTDLSAIHVDANVAESRPNRYRFTLAHEVGHFRLHKDFYNSLPPWKNVAEWRDLILQIPPAHLNWLEQHANTFAGLVLVPEKQLQDAAGRSSNELEQQYPDLRDFPPEARDKVLSEVLALEFEVSSNVVFYRLQKGRKRS